VRDGRLDAIERGREYRDKGREEEIQQYQKRGQD
jgi:hypothetical protein